MIQAKQIAWKYVSEQSVFCFWRIFDEQQGQKCSRITAFPAFGLAFGRKKMKKAFQEKVILI